MLARNARLLLSVLAITASACAVDTETDDVDVATEVPATPGDTTPEDNGPDVDIPAPEPESPGAIINTTIATELGAFPTKARMIGDDAIAEGDIIVPTDVTSATMIGRHWPRGVVPFTIDVNLPGVERITQAIAHWHSKTNIRFVPRTTERDFIQFRSSATACSSNIGQIGDRQFVNVMTGENASSLVAVGIDRTTTPETVHYFYKRGFATSGTVRDVASTSPHFRYVLPTGKTTANLVDVGFASNGHLFAWYDDGTVSEGDAFDFALYASPAPYTLPTGKRPADVAGFAIDKDDRAHAFFKNGTFSVGTTTNLTAAPSAFTVATGKSPADLAHVDVAADGSFVAYYGATDALQTSTGTAAKLAATTTTLGRTRFLGHCSTGSMMHELGHAVGLFHEQTRHDRDEHIEIVWENIDPSNVFNFERHSRMVGTDTGAYDFGSIMHYGPTAFSKNGQRTIVRRDGGSFTEQRQGLSAGDIAGIRAMYP